MENRYIPWWYEYSTEPHPDSWNMGYEIFGFRILIVDSPYSPVPPWAKKSRAKRPMTKKQRKAFTKHYLNKGGS